jgi:putative peptide zinc metalloprotease protein
MNIVRALDVALPDLPERVARQNPPKLDPRVISKEHMEKGDPVVLVKMPGTDLVFRFLPIQWKLIQLFDGVRTFAQVAETFARETGSYVSEEDVRELAGYLQGESKLFYRTAVEQNITLQQELRSSRKKRSRFHIADFSDITIKTWNNADAYIARLYPRVRFLFTPWFVWASIAMFVVMGWMWWDRFAEVWSDSFAFYNFTQKSGRDLIEFWLLFGAMAAIHETAHGLVGKHFGATIEKMGFTLMYFAPSFFCDATQVWVIAGKWARIATSIAGIWLDLVVCFFATVVWWGTATGMTIHDWAYKVMMVTGIGVSILNLNPLIKLDGYLIFSELVAEPSLKESSTAYLSGWLRKRIFGLPIEVPYVPRRKRPFYVIYGLLSGLYSYSLLSFLMIITYHILRSFTPEWAFIPALAIGFWVFRSRIKLLVKFMKILYLDKKERVRAWFTPARTVMLGAAVLVFMLLPVWPDFVEGPFVLRAGHQAKIRATLPGMVTRVDVREGQYVEAGQPLLEMRNLRTESEAALARSELTSATVRATQAGMKYQDFASAEQDRLQRAEAARLLAARLAQLKIVSPISGTLTTPHPRDLLGRPLDEGDLLLEVADSSQLKAELYIPEFAMHDVRSNAPVRLLVNGRFEPISGALASILPSAVPVAPGLVPMEQLQGLNPPRFFLGSAIFKNDGKLLEGMTGTAKIFVGRRSVAGFSARFARELIERRVW